MYSFGYELIQATVLEKYGFAQNSKKFRQQFWLQYYNAEM